MPARAELWCGFMPAGASRFLAFKRRLLELLAAYPQHRAPLRCNLGQRPARLSPAAVVAARLLPAADSSCCNRLRCCGVPCSELQAAVKRVKRLRLEGKQASEACAGGGGGTHAALSLLTSWQMHAAMLHA